MRITQFAERMTKKTGIGELMEDMGVAMQHKNSMRMLGGGNPAHIPEVNAIWRRRTEEILANGAELEETLVNYDTPQGKRSFLESLATLLNKQYGWNLSTRNIAITNGSQSAFFVLLNILAGKSIDGGLLRVQFPLCPEYIGYADQLLEPGALITHRAKIEMIGENFFKYHVDFESLNISDDVSALCVSRPTNPTGNVLTDDEIIHLIQISADRDIPLIVDNAYGAPFPNILFKPVQVFWDDHVILEMSLSKLGLPAVRTGIMIANEEIISALSACNAVVSLSNGSFGQVLIKPLIESGDILTISENIIRPFYQQRSRLAIEALIEAFNDDFPYRIHEPEGSIFIWLWFPELSISSKDLYEKLKKRNVLVVSGHYFFYGLEDPWKHSDECLRLSYAQDFQQFREAAEIIADEVRRTMG